MVAADGEVGLAALAASIFTVAGGGQARQLCPRPAALAGAIGRFVESGSHAELIRAEGHSGELFERQARSYC